MNELNKKLAQWRWDNVECRGGFYDECGDFVEMQGNPYQGNHGYSSNPLCYLVESRDLTKKEIAEYQKDFDNGLAKFVPNKSGWWEAVPDFTDPEFGIAYCFKWLVPKARKQLNDMEFGRLLHLWLEQISWQGEEPALDLCKAIEKLIDAK